MRTIAIDIRAVALLSVPGPASSLVPIHASRGKLRWETAMTGHHCLVPTSGGLDYDGLVIPTSRLEELLPRGPSAQILHYMSSCKSLSMVHLRSVDAI